MSSADDRMAALVALLRTGGRAWANYILAVRGAGGHQAVDPQQVLERELGLLAYEAHANATSEIAGWRQRGYRVLTVHDASYPANLRVVDARPPLLFVAGELRDSDSRSVAVIGTRRPAKGALQLTRELAQGAAAAGFTVVSGMAAGIDSEAHSATLALGRRTLAVVGTGLDHVYPPSNGALQAAVAASGAVVSQFWPESRGSPDSFRARNGVMAGMTLATVIVEAGPTSGTRIQARHALSQGRPVILMEPVLRQDWAQALAEQPGVTVAADPWTAVDLLRR